MQPLFMQPPPHTHTYTIRLISVLGKSNSLGELCLEIPRNVEVKSHTFLASPRDEDEWSRALSGRPTMEHSMFPLQRKHFTFHKSDVYIHTACVYAVPHTVRHSPFQLSANTNFMLNFNLCSDLIFRVKSHHLYILQTSNDTKLCIDIAYFYIDKRYHRITDF